MSGPKTTTTTSKQEQESTATSKPWGPAKDYLIDLYETGKGALDATQGKLFGGDFVTPANATQRSVPGMLTSVAPGLSAGAVPLRDMATRIASGEFLDPNNQILQNAIKAVNDPLRLSLHNQVIPGITDAAMKGGAYGGTGQTLLENQAVSDWTRNSLNNSSTMTLDWLNQRFGDIFKSPDLFKTANTLDLAPATVTGQAGDYERGLDDFDTQDALARYQNELQAPWYGIDDFTRLLVSGGFGTRTGQTIGSTVSQTEQPEADLATQLLQGGLGGLSTLSSLGTAFPQTMGSLGSILAGLMPGAGATAAGASAAGISQMLPILTALSDRRYKTDITQIATAKNGLPIYRFRYLGSRDFTIGFMADEVEKVIPDAVFTNPDGVKYVDYARATEIR